MDTDALRKRFTLLTKYFHRMVLVMKSDVSNIGSQQVEEMARCEPRVAYVRATRAAACLSVAPEGMRPVLRM